MPRIPENPNRQYPPPRSPWVVAMRWHDLLFMHWAVDAAVLRPLIPPALELETFDGSAWLGIVPFRMAGTRARFTPPLPGLSAFPELNVRTYVSAGGRPGVWFFSLDAANRAAVIAARRLFHLAYMDAEMLCRRGGDTVEYHSRRTGPHRTLTYGETRSERAEFVARYGPTGPPRRAGVGTLEHFLTDRYCLYSWSPRGGLYRAEIHHGPWPLRPAEAEIETNSMAAALGIDALPGRPLLHFADPLEVVGWLPGKVRETSGYRDAAGRR